jgi:hypothetical protein
MIPPKLESKEDGLYQMLMERAALPEGTPVRSFMEIIPLDPGKLNKEFPKEVVSVSSQSNVV